MITKITTDLHTHTIASGHAYTTLMENVDAAAEKGLEAIAVTEHGPAMPGSVEPIYFHNLRVIPKKHKNVTIFTGIEANILDYNGTLDLDKNMLKKLDFVIASMHSNILKSGSKNENTQNWLKVIQNPLVCCIGHPSRGSYDYDLDTVIEAAKKHNVLIEFNAKTIESERHLEKSKEIVLACKRFGTKVVINSDAHVSLDIGEFDHLINFLNELNFPEELIINRNLAIFETWLNDKKRYST
ncbi:MAG: phosphatase [Clostridiaceae bacterium]|nr:phosphatase [Clostridiaceae bacterium]